MSDPIIALRSQQEVLGVVRHLQLHPNKEVQVLRYAWQLDEELLTDSRPFYWSSEPICATLDASRTVPLEGVVSEWNIDVPNAWWYFETPLPIETTVSANGAPIRALSQGWVRGNFVVIAYVDVAPDKMAYGSALWPSQVFTWRRGVTIAEMLSDCAEKHDELYGPGKKWANKPHTPKEQFVRSAERIARFVLAGHVWLQQKIACTESVRPSRPERRRYERETKREAPDVQIVHLRRYDRSPEEPPEGASNRDWTCRWTVDGHWRQQACGPNFTERRLTFVHPYVKGPADKPLRTREKIYAADR